MFPLGLEMNKITLDHRLGIARVHMAHGHEAIVDIQDVDVIATHHWYSSKGRKTRYAYSDVGKRPNRKHVAMHRLIVDAPSGLVVDHINGNGLDNRRDNLRICTVRQNLMNEPPRKGAYKGVSRCATTNRWVAQIKSNRSVIFIGRFDTPEEAARAYDERAFEMHGEFAFLNFPISEGTR